ncbi:hypothetical protein [Chryseobacterium pennipullorum]|uniref:YD repeat-containing protein n=1 Tax=Chryseobacterium pennipullorum TaxID=2258963 RepID=A0A3D9B6U0_9FLAO|nr:hypothetical protein [Chryseobacterium pennipullorum]REC49381.1 hypothetical protein DRF67_02555 [Chryseobacterium pennipullorum]
MKTQLCIGLMSSFLLFNCSTNTEENNDPNTSEPQILLSKTTTVYHANSTNPSTDVVKLDYNSQKQLVKMSSENRIAVLEYDLTGKPLKVNYEKPDGTGVYYKTCHYNGDQLTMVKTIYPTSTFNTTITYSNAKVSSISICKSSNCTNPFTKSFLYIGDNVSEENSQGDGIGSPYHLKREFSYDSNVNPYSLINKYVRVFIGGPEFLSQNLSTTEKISTKYTSGNWTQIQNITYQVEYNNSQLPTLVVGKDDNGNEFVRRTYEYIIQ